MQKLQLLKDWMKKEGRVVVAFSGGVDSALLAYTAHRALGKDMIAVTGDSPSIPAGDRTFVTSFCKKYGIGHRFIDTHEMKVRGYKNNPPERCYYCKRELFVNLAKFARRNHYRSVLDGTNASDIKGHRPGYRAIKEMKFVKTPYIELSITKADIRAIASFLGLEVSSKPASACLASRIPWGKRIDAKDLRLVDRAEDLLKKLGLTEVRVRHHGELARIQCVQKEFSLALEVRKKIGEGLKKLGYKFVTFDTNFYGE